MKTEKTEEVRLQGESEMNRSGSIGRVIWLAMFSRGRSVIITGSVR